MDNGGFMLNFKELRDTLYVQTDLFTRSISQQLADTTRYQAEVFYATETDYRVGESRLILEFSTQFGWIAMEDKKTGRCLKLIAVDGKPLAEAKALF